jgi:hypothetical protein
LTEAFTALACRDHHFQQLKDGLKVLRLNQFPQQLLIDNLLGFSFVHSERAVFVLQVISQTIQVGLTEHLLEGLNNHGTYLKQFDCLVPIRRRNGLSFGGV